MPPSHIILCHPFSCPQSGPASGSRFPIAFLPGRPPPVERLKEACSQSPQALSSPSSHCWPSGAGGSLPGHPGPAASSSDPPGQKRCSPQRGSAVGSRTAPAPGGRGLSCALAGPPLARARARRFLLHVRFHPKTRSRRTGRTRQVRPGPWPHAVPARSAQTLAERPARPPGSVLRALGASGSAACPPVRPPLLTPGPPRAGPCCFELRLPQGLALS